MRSSPIVPRFLREVADQNLSQCRIGASRTAPNPFQFHWRKGVCKAFENASYRKKAENLGLLRVGTDQAYFAVETVETQGS